MSKTYGFAVVIPFAKTAALLSMQVESLIPQLANRHEGILVLSCNSAPLFSSSETRDLVEYLQMRSVNVLLLDSSDKKGPSYARNVAWKKTNAKIFLFCDDDDVVGKDWVKNMLDSLSHFDLVGGSLDYQELNDERHSVWQPSRSSELPSKFSYLPFSPTCNLGVHREVLETTKGFDEELLCAQDIDFCWRAQTSGFVLGFAEDAIVSYRLRSSNKSIFLQAYKYGIGDAILLKKHQSSGVSVSKSESARNLVSLIFSTVSAPFDRKVSGKFAHRWGLMLGHLVGSLRLGVWVL
jgi:GT2 family glycosyltransferase